MHLGRHISQSIRGMGSGDNFTPDISERSHISNVRELYQYSNIVNYIGQMLKNIAWSAGLVCMQVTLS